MPVERMHHAGEQKVIKQIDALRASGLLMRGIARALSEASQFNSLDARTASVIHRGLALGYPICSSEAPLKQDFLGMTKASRMRNKSRLARVARAMLPQRVIIASLLGGAIAAGALVGLFSFERGWLGESARGRECSATEEIIPVPANARVIANLHAFSKLYGYVRYFHPSDQAASADWERLAVYGSREVMAARDDAELKEVLGSLFQPLAPTMLLYPTGEGPGDYSPPPKTGGGVVVWQHLGVGLGNRGPYKSVRLNRDTDVPIFSAVPRFDEFVDKPLDGDLRVRLPLALPAGVQDSDSAIPGVLSSVDTMEPTDLGVRLGAVIVAWNILQHFYPYSDIIETDWDQALTRALQDALDDSTAQVALLRLVAALEDGHGHVRQAGVRDRVMPVRFAWIEKQLVIDESQATEVQRGDIVLEIDGESAPEALSAAIDLVSGSPQWKRHKALVWLRRRPNNVPVPLVLERNGMRIETSVLPGKTDSIPPPRSNREPIEELADGTYYVDLDRASEWEIRQHLNAIAAAPAVIFDLRGYPNGNHFILGHLLREPCEHDWMWVPQTVYPDGERAGWSEQTWGMQPEEPRISGNVAFLTGPGAISYAESVMGHVEGHQLGDIVGSSTAGTNGNVNPFSLPGGFTVSWTGMKVTKHDGSQHHLVGVQPTVPVERTLAGLRADRDEVFEAAHELVASSAALGSTSAIK